MNMGKKITALGLSVLLLLSMAACGAGKTTVQPDAVEPEKPAALESEGPEYLGDSPEWVSRLYENMGSEASQLFVVAAVGQTTAYVSMHEKDEDGAWKVVVTTPGLIGKNGMDKEREGDGKTPTGGFHFNYAFGIADDPGCALEYHKVTADDYWSGDTRDGYGYNTMVNIKDLPDLDKENSEHIVDYTAAYQYCLNISYNEDCVPDVGSAIFLHCFREDRPYTGGCVAIPREQMIRVMQRVRPDCEVVIHKLEVIAPELWEAWGFGPAAVPADETVEANGFFFRIPGEVRDLVTIQTSDFDDGSTLISVYETASVEAARAQGENDTGAGWLFGISAVTRDTFNRMRCYDMSGSEAFAGDDQGIVFLYDHPTDVRLVRESYDDMEEDLAQWSMLNEWASGEVRAAFMEDNEGLHPVTAGNTELDIFLARAAFMSDANYSVTSLSNGTMEPVKEEAAAYLAPLMDGVRYEYVDDGEAPDGEYIVLAFPDDDVRFDFFMGDENVIREVISFEEGETEQLFRAVFDEEGLTATGVMQAWYDALAEAGAELATVN